MRRIVAVLALLSLLVPASQFALADTMSSTNYKIQADTLSIGGNRSTSSGYIVEDTIGDFATGEGLASTNFEACSGYQCFQGTPYITFSVTQGTSAPGTAGAGVALGTLSTGSVKTSDGSAINSIFVTAESNAAGGTVVRVRDTNAGLKRVSTADTITSSTATLVAGTAGYGLCVFSATQHAESPTAFVKQTPFDGTCTKTTGHGVGLLTTSAAPILQSTGSLKGGSAEILVKAAISPLTPAGADYADTITLVATGTY
jgi:hypothetical protein